MITFHFHKNSKERQSFFPFSSSFVRFFITSNDFLAYRSLKIKGYSSVGAKERAFYQHCFQKSSQTYKDKNLTVREGREEGVFTCQAEILWASELRSEINKNTSQCFAILQVLNKSYQSSHGPQMAGLFYSAVQLFSLTVCKDHYQTEFRQKTNTFISSAGSFSATAF